ncbi:MAG TPA: TPM domain-containing protein [Thiobacillaceae bacterium]|nr:TPM domain-containing protein [Thiobacillaceae bacterium]
MPALSQRVTDLTGSTLSATDIQQLDSKLAELEARKGSQIAILIIPSLEGEDIASFGIRVADKWKVGRKGIDDGVILIVAKNDHRMRIEVGYGLEGAIPDAVANRVISEIMAPKFRAGDFAGGINAGVDQLIRWINGEPLPQPAKPQGQNSSQLGSAFIFSLIGGIIGGAILSMLIGRTGGSLLGAVGAGLAGWLLSGLLMLGIFNAFLVLSMLGGLGRGGGGWSSGGWGGGGFGGGGFGGGGGSSWGGGGGGFGGGGSSGSW